MAKERGGSSETFRAQCNPVDCDLNRWTQLGNAKVWAWFLELIDWEDGGAKARVDRDVAEMSPVHVRAYVAFRSELAEQMSQVEARAAAAASRR